MQLEIKPFLLNLLWSGQSSGFFGFCGSECYVNELSNCSTK